VSAAIEKNPFVSIVLFGSSAKGTRTNTSDLDLAFFVPSAQEKRACELTLKTVELEALLPIDAHVFTKDEMLAMLADERENLGKEIARNNVAVHNPRIFDAILREGVKRGFNPHPPES